VQKAGNSKMPPDKAVIDNCTAVKRAKYVPQLKDLQKHCTDNKDREF
jgi:hypothetical protein